MDALHPGMSPENNNQIISKRCHVVPMRVPLFSSLGLARLRCSSTDTEPLQSCQPFNEGEVPVLIIQMSELSFQLRSPTLSSQLYCVIVSHAVRCIPPLCRQRQRLRQIAPLCSRNVAFDAMSGFHFLKQTLEATRSFFLTYMFFRTFVGQVNYA